jgi:hypothetical protein
MHLIGIVSILANYWVSRYSNSVSSSSSSSWADDSTVFSKNKPGGRGFCQFLDFDKEFNQMGLLLFSKLSFAVAWLFFQSMHRHCSTF